MNDDEILDEFCTTRNLRKGTRDNYKYAIKDYTNFQGLSLSELLDEAEQEEEAGVRWKHRQLKRRLLNYRAYLHNHLNELSASKRFTQIKGIYKHYDIEIHDLPPISSKNSIKSKQVMYEDLPTKEELKEAISISNPLMKALILFMSSSGCANAETTSLTIKDFIDATSEYHNSNNIYDAISELKDKEDVIPTWRITRIKTGKEYITFSSPESTLAIIHYLETRKKGLSNIDKLFDIHKAYTRRLFQGLNDKLNLGKINSFAKLRTHTLRKFHASNLYNHGLSLDVIDELQGRGKTGSRASYFYQDTNKLKEKYIGHIEAILIEQEVTNLTVESEEFKTLKKQNEKLTEQMKEIEDIKKTLESLL